MLARQDPEHLLDAASSAIGGDPERRAMIDEIDVPVYATDAEGCVTYWNRACVEFAGREPKLGQDRWCISWQLFETTGEPMPRENCPMAQAIRTRQKVRNVIAIAERPDGSRVAFRPHPTPIFDENGRLTGAVNLLIDVTEEQSAALHEQARRCRRLAEATYDRTTSKVLGDMASGFEKAAGELDRRRS